MGCGDVGAWTGSTKHIGDREVGEAVAVDTRLGTVGVLGVPGRRWGRTQADGPPSGTYTRLTPTAQADVASMACASIS